MARPRVFISSTFFNLKQVRASLEEFVRSIGYDPVITDNITYLPDQPLDESCYAEAGTCDLFVLIIGGRYGSEGSATKNQKQSEKEFYERYKSITRLEFEAALRRDVPIYVLVDKAVQADYRTYLLNKGNDTVRYAHVDSIGVFDFVEFIRERTQKPVREFERANEIIDWLKEQWGGLFQKMLSDRSEITRLRSLEKQVRDLEEISITMKRYLEEIIGTSAGPRGDVIIEEETARLKEKMLESELMEHSVFSDWVQSGLTKDETKAIFRNVEDAGEFAEQAIKHKLTSYSVDQLLQHWSSNDLDVINDINSVRALLGARPLSNEA